MDHNFVCDT